MGLMKKLTSAIVASSLVLSAAGTVLAAPSADEQSASYARMEALKLVVGTDRGAELEGELTRAQLLTIIVRAFNQEGTANLLKDLGSFSDVPGGQWYSGYVAVAKNLATERGFAIGYPDGTFQPNKQVSVIEALAMIMKFLGVPTGTGDNWIAQTIENAKAAGVITDADVEKYLSEPNAPATRGVAFALADQIFSTYKVAGEKTVYTYYVDTVAPTLTVTKPANPTTTAATYTVQGIVESGADVYVDGNKATVANGSFSFEVNLKAGENTITVSAVDIAGNVTTETITITRVAGEAAKIVAEDLEVAAGSETELSFKVVDANDLELADAAADVKVTLSEGIGTYEDGIFKASEKAGKGTITLTYGDLTETIEVTIVPGPLAGIKLEGGVESVAPGEAIRLIAVDEFGNEIEGATFSADHANVFIKDNKFFTATKPGAYTVTATVGEVTKEGTILVYGELDDLKIEVQGQIVANDKTEYTVIVKAVDENGALVRDFDEEIILDSDLTIRSDKAVKAVNGVATFKVRAPLDLEEADIIATYDDITSKITVEIAEQEATAIKLTGDKYLGLGWRALPFSGTVKVVDQEGVDMKSDDDWEVTLKVEGPAYFNDDEDRTLREWVTKDGYKFSLVSADFDTEGEVTITATAPGLKSAELKVNAVYAGAPRNIVISEKDTDTYQNGSIYKIGLTDRNGVPVYAATDHEIKLTFNTDKISAFWSNSDSSFPTTALTLDRKAATVVFPEGEDYMYLKVTANPTDSLPSSFSVRATSTGLNSASADINFDAAEAVAVVFEDADEYHAIFLRPDAETNLSFKIVDEYGNVVKDKVKVRLTASGRVKVNGKSEVTVYTDDSGKGTVRVVAPWNMVSGGGAIDIDADFGKTGDFEAAGVVYIYHAQSDAKTVKVSTADSKYKYDYEDASSNPIPVRFTVTVRDNAGRVMTRNDYDESNLVVYRDGTELTTQPSFTWLPDGKTIAFDLDTHKIGRGPHEITVRDVASAYTAKGSVKVTIEDVATDVGFADKDAGEPLSIAVANLVSKTVTVELRDADDNIAKAQQFVVVVTVTHGDGYVKKADGTWDTSATFAVTTNASSKSFTVRGVTDVDDVVFTVEVFEADGITPIGSPLTLTLTAN